MHFDAEFYVAAGFVVFLAVLGYYGVHRQITKALDDRSARIRAELDEAKRLREEANGVLEGYKRKRAEADVTAKAIVEQARAEAQMLASEAEARMVDFVARRTKQATDKIATAESQAMAEVRAAAADAAVKAAATVLRADTVGQDADALVDREIGALAGRLN